MQHSNVTNSLVSVIVITYNSSQYVIETLESIKTQTYKNIELIISDDCSTDETVTICIKWINENKENFVRTELIIQTKNSGLPANCNRGVNASKGEWVKIIAGDDLLVNDAIETIVGFVQEKDCDVLVTQYKPFYNVSGERSYGDVYPNTTIAQQFFNKSPQAQFKLLIKEKYIFILGLFVKRELIEVLEGFNEKYRLIEDLPFLIKISQEGYAYSYLPKVTLLYRYHLDSISHSKNSTLGFNPNFIINLYQIYRDIWRMHISFFDRVYFDFKFGCYNFLIKNNVKSKWVIKLVLLAPLYLTPKLYITKIRALF